MGTYGRVDRMSTIRRRVQQLEHSAPAPPAYDHVAYRERWIEAAERLASTMTAEHQQIVLDDLKAGRFYLSQGAKPLTNIFSNDCSCYASQDEYHSGRPLDLRPEIATHYVDGGAVSHWGECEQCGLLRPHTRTASRGGLPAFAQCPLCGGSIGRNVWRNPNHEKTA